MKAIVAMSDKGKSGIVQRVLRAGGASVTVSTTHPPLNSELEGHSVCFVDSDTVNLNSMILKYTSDDISSLLLRGQIGATHLELVNV